MEFFIGGATKLIGSDYPVCSFPSSSIGVDSHGIADGISADYQDGINPTSSHLVHGSNIQTHNIDDVAKLFGVSLNTLKDIDDFVQELQLGKHELWPLLSKEKGQEINRCFVTSYGSLSESASMPKVNPIVQSVDINIKSTSYASDASANLKEKPKVSSNFRPLVADPVFNGVNISILCKVVEKVSTRFEHTLYDYFIGKRLAFPVVEYYAWNNWGKHGLKRIMMNTKGFFFFKFDSKAGLEAVLESGPWMIRNTPIILNKWSMSTSLLKDELTRIPIWVKLHDVPLQVFEEDEVDLVDVVTIGIPSLTGDDFTKEIIRVEYEWRPPRCDECKIFRYVHDHGPKKVKKRKRKFKSTNGGQFAGPSIKQTVRYELEATTNAPKKEANNVSNPSKSSSMLKTANSSPKKDNFTTSNSFSALNAEEEDDEEEVENVYDESANLVPNTKTGERSSFTAAAG
ncbi:zinc knuckle CX2CX4HX4C containing protein [Tanacetum coccineum]